MSSQKPTIFFIPGAWHPPEGFDDVRASLANRGFPSAAVALPSVGAEPPSKTLTDDTAVVQSEIEKLADQGKQLVVVAHSYGGMVGAGAVKGMGYAERQKAGKKGGVLILVYLAAFVAKSGTSLLDMMGGNWLPWQRLDGDYMWSSEEERVFYHDLSAPEQEKWISKLKHHSVPPFREGVSHEPWHDLPCMYIFCEDDQAIPLAFQESMAATLGDYAQVRLKASHSPFLSMPDKLAEACEMAANVGLEKITA